MKLIIKPRLLGQASSHDRGWLFSISSRSGARGRWQTPAPKGRIGVQGDVAPGNRRFDDMAIGWYPARCAKCLKRFVPKSRRSKVCQECAAKNKQHRRGRRDAIKTRSAQE